jgi:hypothetical protein
MVMEKLPLVSTCKMPGEETSGPMNGETPVRRSPPDRYFGRLWTADGLNTCRLWLYTTYFWSTSPLNSSHSVSSNRLSLFGWIDNLQLTAAVDSTSKAEAAHASLT